MSDPQKVSLQIPRIRKEVYGGQVFIYNMDTDTLASLWDNDDNEISQPITIAKDGSMPQVANGLFLNVGTQVRWVFSDINEKVQYANSESFPPYNPDLDSRMSVLEGKLAVWLVQNLTADNTSEVVSLLKQTYNLDSGQFAFSNINIPQASAIQAGTMSKEQVQTLQALVSTMAGVAHSAVILGLPANPDTATLDAAFNTELGFAASPGDRIIDIDHDLVWVHRNDASWLNVGAPTDLATNTNAGSIIGNQTDGGVVFGTSGVGEVQGWSNVEEILALTTQVSNIIIAGGSYAIPEDSVKTYEIRQAGSSLTIQCETASNAPRPVFINNKTNNDNIFINFSFVDPNDGSISSVSRSLPRGLSFLIVNKNSIGLVQNLDDDNAWDLINVAASQTITISRPTIIRHTNSSAITITLNSPYDRYVPVFIANWSTAAVSVVQSSGSNVSIPGSYTYSITMNRTTSVYNPIGTFFVPDFTTLSGIMSAAVGWTVQSQSVTKINTMPGYSIVQMDVNYQRIGSNLSVSGGTSLGNIASGQGSPVPITSINVRTSGTGTAVNLFFVNIDTTGALTLVTTTGTQTISTNDQVYIHAVYMTAVN